jgi:hypothetical protein
MAITIDELKNPFGKGSTVVALKLIEQDLRVRYHSKIQSTMKVEILKEKESYIIHASIPSEGNIKSENNKKIFYDVLLEFKPKNKESLTSPSIRDYDLYAFSNSPGFMFTYTNIYKQYKSLFNLPTKYYSSKALKQSADIRNPYSIIGTEKSIWWTIYYMEQNMLFRKTVIDTIVNKKLSLSTVISKITTQDNKLIEVQTRDAARVKANKKKKYNNPTEGEEEVLSDKNKREFSMASNMKSNLASSTMKHSLKTDMKNSLKSKI